MFDIILCISIAFTITYLSIPVIIVVANSKKLYDVPDARKIHDVPIPSLGGLGIFAGFVIASLTIINFSEAADFQYFFAACFVIFFLGLKDDILDITPIKKFIGQVGAAYHLQRQYSNTKHARFPGHRPVAAVRAVPLAPPDQPLPFPLPPRSSGLRADRLQPRDPGARA